MTTRKKTRQQEPEPTVSQPSTMGSPEEEAQRFQVSGVWPPTLDLLDDDVAGPSSVSKLEVVTERRTDEDITAADNRRFLGRVEGGDQNPERHDGRSDAFTTHRGTRKNSSINQHCYPSGSNPLPRYQIEEKRTKF